MKDESNPEGDITIEFQGLRPGEKLYEELLIGDDVVTTEHPKIMRANEGHLSGDEVAQLLARSAECLEAGDSEGLRGILLQAVSEFEPSSANVDLVRSVINSSSDSVA